MFSGGIAVLKAYAVVTPLRKAASYEQRKTNLGNKIFGSVLSRSATYYAALTRLSSLPPRRRHDSRKGLILRGRILKILKFLSTFQKASHRPRKGPRNYHVLPRRCRIWHELATYHPKSLKWLYVAHTRWLYAKV